MNFFSHQDQARSATRKLVFLFLAAVITLILITSFLIIGVLFYAENQGQMGLTTEFLSSKIFIQVSLVVVAVVGLGTLYRMAQLRGGGKTVAEAMGGRLLNTNTRDADERKILNVVEEMAIASGISVPSVYLMEEESINAFAAGYKPRDAVIGITRGCIQQLSRNELQGVVAHEFSHIFNGDMRLNIRLMGLLYGITVLGIIGYHMLRSSSYRRRTRSGNDKGGGLVMLGAGLVVVGFGGTFFGNLIKSAVSRQREYLADASAVQYTRNPDGISGALKKIGGFYQGSEIRGKDASEISHMLFCNGLRKGFSNMFATHPPLADRIRRIDPHWQGEMVYTSDTQQAVKSEEGVSHFAGSASPGPDTVPGGESAIAAIGNPGPEHLGQAAAILQGLPAAVQAEVHNSMGSTLLIYSLLLCLSDETTANRQRALLQEKLEEKDLQALEQISADAATLPRDKYLTLIELAMPSLKQLSPVQYRHFMTTLTSLITADDDIFLFEWCLYKILRYTLDERPGRRVRAIGIKHLTRECEVLLSVLATAGHGDAAQAEAAFNRAEDYLELDKDLVYRKELGINTGELEKAMDRLNNLKPLQKPLLLKAMVSCINADGQVTVEESELLRATGSLLDCPIPPLLPNQRFI